MATLHRAIFLGMVVCISIPGIAFGESTLVGPLKAGEQPEKLDAETGKRQTPTRQTNAQSSSNCLGQLEQVANFSTVATPVAVDPQCTVESPVQLHRTAGTTTVVFPANPILNCTFALALATYTSKSLSSLSRDLLSKQVASVQTGEGFICRRRNNKPDGKLSEHAFGNAIDIVSLRFVDGSSLNIQSAELHSQPNAKFQRNIREQACANFSTVLGPGSNAAHASHLHFDLGRSKGNPNPYRICE